MSYRCAYWAREEGGRGGAATRSGLVTLCSPQLQIAAAEPATPWMYAHIRTQMHTPLSVTSSTPPSQSSNARANMSQPAWLLRYQPIRLALAFSVSLRTRPFEEVPKVIDESSNSSCLCSSSESSSMYQADRRPWLRVRMDPPASSPASSSSLGGSFRLGRWVWSGGVPSSLALLLLLLSGEGSGDSGGGAGSSILTTRGRPRRLGVDAMPESDNTSCAEDMPPSSPVDGSTSSSGVKLLRLPLCLVSSASCLLFLPLFLPGGRPRGLEGLAGVETSGGLTGGSVLDFLPLLPTPRVTWLPWPFRWTVLWDEVLPGEPEMEKNRSVNVYVLIVNLCFTRSHDCDVISYLVCVEQVSWVSVECFRCYSLWVGKVSPSQELVMTKLAQSYEPATSESTLLMRRR